ncbi:MAG: thioredoxin family protein [Clostridia bacterium]|nr:thioredoxin family protein [Clostridia bacterium]
MVNNDNFKDKFKGLQVIEFSGESCANCLTLMPLLYNVVSSRPNLSLLHFEAGDNTMKVFEHYKVDRVPTVILLDDGVEFARAIGYQPEEIFELWIDAKLEEHLKNS